MNPNLTSIQKHWMFSTVYSVDRVHIWINDSIFENENFKTELLPYCAGVHFEKRSRLKRAALHLSQPSEQAFQFLISRSDVGNIFYIEVAKDILTFSVKDASTLHQFVLAHTIERWRGKKITGKCFTTDYSSNKRNVRKNTVKYSDRASKITGTSCFHEERRIYTQSAVIASGLTLETLSNLNQEAISKWWNKRPTNYYRFDFEKLARRFKGLTKREGRLGVKSKIKTYLGGKLILHELKRAGAIYLRNAEYKYYENLSEKSDDDLPIGTKNLQRAVDVITSVYGYQKMDYLVPITPPDYL